MMQNERPFDRVRCAGGIPCPDQGDERIPEGAEKERGMSRHSSFGGSGKIKVRRNVLKRYERIDVLKAKGKWKEGDKALGLAKTRITG